MRPPAFALFGQVLKSLGKNVTEFMLQLKNGNILNLLIIQG